MPEERLGLDEVEKRAEKFVCGHMKIDLNIQEIEINHIMPDELGDYYEIEGKVKKRSASSMSLQHIFNDFFDTKKEETAKECLFKLKVSAKGGEILDYDFKDIEPSQYIVDMSSTRESLRDTLGSIDNSIRENAVTDLLKEIKEDIRDRRRRRKHI